MDQNRGWMYNRLDGKYLSKAFITKVDEFIAFACQQEEFKRCQKLKCPCMKCRSRPYHDVDTIKFHLFQRGFQPNYYMWVHHGEPFPDEQGACPSSPNVEIVTNPMRDMVMNAYTPATVLLQEATRNTTQEPIPEAKVAKESLDKIITWMTDDIRQSLKNMRENDEEFKKQSQRNKKSKVEGLKAKISHSQGSISSTMWFHKSAKALNRKPFASKLFVATHSKIDETGRRIWFDDHAQSVYEKYEQLKADTNVQVGSEADDRIFYKACGVWSDKGTIYGLGREGPSMFPRPSRSKGSSAGASSSYPSLLVTQRQGQLQTIQTQLQTIQTELQTTQSRLHSTKEELKTTREQLQDIRKQLEVTRKQLDDQRMDLLELNAQFDSFLAMFGYPTTHGDNSLDSS
uniref:Transposase-associated domain-containing protein n=1 Tax=Opuntia streptacantha TaxID=393608 RepID=A0A7C9D1T7_OPUST